MRLTTLLDGSTQDTSRAWPTRDTTTRDTPTRNTATTRLTDAEAFDRLVATMVPCRQNDPELWFAEGTADVERAKDLCRQCPLRRGCLEGALQRREPWGVWGGEVFVGGVVVPRKRGRGRPRKDDTSAA